MMYKENLAVAVKVNGKVLREHGDIIYMPFGQEYTILLKNLSSARASVKIDIDGTDATDGVSLIVDANSELELRRFIRNGNMESGNRFKFIERTEAIESGPRGINIDDGLIRIAFEFESPTYDHLRSCSLSQVIQQNEFRRYQTKGISDTSLSMQATAVTNSLLCSNNVSTAVAQSAPGITVPGAREDQKFSTVYGFKSSGTKHVCVLHLQGVTPRGMEVDTPVTVRSKIKCITCGHASPTNMSFCGKCGTSLEII